MSQLPLVGIAVRQSYPRILSGTAQAQLIEEEGDAAIITGHIVNIDNNKIGFNVYIKPEKKQDWNSWHAQGGTYFGFTLEALRAAKANHTLWTFWQLSPGSYLEGTGDVSARLAA